MTLPARWAPMAVGVIGVALAIGGATLVSRAPTLRSSPVQLALGLDDAGVPTAEAAAILERRRAVEVARRTTACMAAAGFDYIARPEPPVSIPDAELDPVSWAARWGFGISTSIGVEVPIESGPSTPVLSDAQRGALYGDADTPGCHERARAEVHGLRDRLLEPLAAPLASLQASIDGDPAMIGIVERWQQCASTATDAASARVVDRQTLDASVLADFARRVSAIADADSLERLRAAERRVAVALAICESAYGEARVRIAHPYEMAFVESYRAALADVGAAIRAAESAYPPDPGP